MARMIHTNAKRVAQKKYEQSGQRRRARRKAWLASFSLVSLLVGLALFYVWLRLQVVHMGYVLASTTKLQNQIEHENRELKVELATLTSPDRLEAMARRRLGMMPPERGQVIILP